MRISKGSLRSIMLWIFLACLGFSVGNIHATLPICHAGPPQSAPSLGGAHVPDCTPLNIAHYPPTSGTHYGAWAKFQIYDQPVSPGYWLHSAEHGAVIFLYNCPKSCAEEVAALKSLINSLPMDTLCTSISSYKVDRRVILAPDSRTDSAFSVVAWGWSLKSNCLDTAALHAFYTAHYAQTSEDICGGSGAVDYSASRWCDEKILGLPELAPKVGKKKGQLLWEGSLAERIHLVLEVSRLNGELLKTIDLGYSGPGSVKTIWDGSNFFDKLGIAQALVGRLEVKGPSRENLILSEHLILP